MIRGKVRPSHIAITTAALVLITTPVFGTADLERADETMKACKASMAETDSGEFGTTWDDGYQSGFCTGWILGVNGVVAWASNEGETAGQILGCPDAEVTFEQATRVFVRYAEAHPEMYHEPNLVVLSRAMRAAFPCEDGES